MQMPVVMLGGNYRYAYAPAGLGADTVSTEYKTDAAKIINNVLTTGVSTLPGIINAIQGDSTLSTQQKKDATDLATQTYGTWFERNQTLIVAGGVLVLVGMVAVQTTRRRRSRR